MSKLDGRIAIVTGASRGIGEEIARLFAQEGARVVCAARTLNEGDHRLLSGSLSGTVAKIREAGGAAVAVAVDVSREEECQRLVKIAQDTFGTVDILVNDAALTYYKAIVGYNVRHWVKAFAVNVHGPFMLSQLVLPGMIQTAPRRDREHLVRVGHRARPHPLHWRQASHWWHHVRRHQGGA
jgi:NAD(P)-dependent dehydrogenase (short-subunit alcohol dehydrogenase family)